MDAINNHTSRLEIDAEIARLWQTSRALQARQDQWQPYSHWKIALAGSLTGLAVISGGILVGLAVIRAFH